MYVDLNQDSRRDFYDRVHSFRNRPGQVFWDGMRNGASGVASGVGMLARQAATVRRGEVVSTALGRTSGLVSYPALAGTMAAGSSALAAGMGLTIPFLGPVAAVAALYPAWKVGTSVSHMVRGLSQSAHDMRRLHMGGQYTDTATAGQLRMQAIYEMSGAVQTSRRYLGQEAFFLHR